jgi:hypothetical protein
MVITNVSCNTAGSRNIKRLYFKMAEFSRLTGSILARVLSAGIGSSVVQKVMFG